LLLLILAFRPRCLPADAIVSVLPIAGAASNGANHDCCRIFLEGVRAWRRLRLRRLNSMQKCQKRL